jgi:cephalosporin hydroxylase
MTHTITIDLEAGTLVDQNGVGARTLTLDDPRAFAALSAAWLRSGWQTKHVYTFTWMGRPIIQLPEDMLRVQEAIYTLQPDVIIETGIAHGGSLIYYASLCKLLGRGRVVGVDIEIRPHNRKAIEEHELYEYITLIEGDSIAGPTVERVKSYVGPADKTFIMLDGCHTRDHVKAELDAYSPLVTVGSYIVAADGVMRDLAGLKRQGDDRPNDDWAWNNPVDAVKQFVDEHDNFVVEPPPFAFNESPIQEAVTYWPHGWLKRIK